MFNPEQFLDMQVTDSNDTKSIPVPVGEYTAVAEEVKCRQWQSKQDPSKSGLTLDITDSGGLDMGKGRNIGLSSARSYRPQHPRSAVQLLDGRWPRGEGQRQPPHRR